MKEMAWHNMAKEIACFLTLFNGQNKVLLCYKNEWENMQLRRNRSYLLVERPLICLNACLKWTIHECWSKLKMIHFGLFFFVIFEQTLPFFCFCWLTRHLLGQGWCWMRLDNDLSLMLFRNVWHLGRLTNKCCWDGFVSFLLRDFLFDVCYCRLQFSLSWNMDQRF